MFSTLEPFLTAEIAYRRERALESTSGRPQQRERSLSRRRRSLHIARRSRRSAPRFAD